MQESILEEQMTEGIWSSKSSGSFPASVLESAHCEYKDSTIEQDFVLFFEGHDSRPPQCERYTAVKKSTQNQNFASPH